MEYTEFVHKQDAYRGFVEMRKMLNELLEHPGEYNREFEDLFADVGALAMAGNPIAQDVMSYYYKIGAKDIIKENYDLFMKWSILAAANGNEFAIEKLQFFLNYALTEVISSENLQKIIEKNSITGQNYIYILGNLLCEGLVDALKINTKQLVEEQNRVVKYTPERLRSYKRELEKVIPRIVEYLLA